MKEINLDFEKAMHSLILQKLILTSQVETLKVALLQIVKINQGEIVEIQIKYILENEFENIRNREFEAFLQNTIFQTMKRIYGLTQLT